MSEYKKGDRVIIPKINGMTRGRVHRVGIGPLPIEVIPSGCDFCIAYKPEDLTRADFDERQPLPPRSMTELPPKDKKNSWSSVEVLARKNSQVAEHTIMNYDFADREWFAFGFFKVYWQLYGKLVIGAKSEYGRCCA